MFKNIKAVGCLTDYDYQFFISHYDTNAKKIKLIYSMQYFIDDTLNYLESLRVKKSKNNLILNIQIGHSCDYQLHHIETYQQLSSVANCFFYSPLSYGNKEYQNMVMKVGKEILNARIEFITEYMSLNQYNEFINKMDVLVMNADRQIGLGNIFSAILLDVAICVPKDSPLYIYLVEELGITVLVYQDVINQKKFNLSTIDFSKNRQIINILVSKMNFCSKWAPLLGDD